ncbi:MAG TPA: polysaccharide biosynthesis/export family protein [Gemmataceae bacterium]|nr:polysaccharide biosynthesis/export family protein [Gemmataceae bacterium]
MSGRLRINQLQVLWGVWATCLMAMGCQAQFSFLGGPLESKPPARKDAPAAQGPVVKPGDQAAMPAVGQTANRPDSTSATAQATSGLMQTAYLSADRPDKGKPAQPMSAPGLKEQESGSGVPVELCKSSLPPYVIEPPDILLIDAVRLTPLGPYRLEPGDVLQIRVADTLPNQPLVGPYAVSLEGTVNLGFSYGVVKVAGLSAEQAEQAIRKQLSRTLTNPQVAVSLLQFRGVQQTRGKHLVRPDGTIGLGIYGSVYVSGMTLAQAKAAIEKQLSQFMADPDISLDVFAYNSKVYYVICNGGGCGEQVHIFPSTGNETVLDAIGRLNGLPAGSSKRRIWVARPAPSCVGCFQILPVDWHAITRGAQTETNYQIFPGDRIYVEAAGWLHR